MKTVGLEFVGSLDVSRKNLSRDRKM